MFPPTNRWLQSTLLTLLWAGVCLPNLGGPPLWEIDEGLNSQCSHEMLEAADWIVPHFNFEMRDAKPALLYWLQASCYSLLGVNETAARLPSALACLLAVLIVCELGRRLFNPTTGLLAGVILTTSVSPCIAAHFANPDALLLVTTLAALASFWYTYTHWHSPRTKPFWFGPWGCAARLRVPGPLVLGHLGGGVFLGLAVLAKGPVGLLLPLGIVGLFLLWQRQLRWLWQSYQFVGALAFVLTAGPWYVWVAVETKGKWLFRFWKLQHVNRAFGVMENHGGPFFVYLLFLLVGLAPWSIFFAMTVAHTFRRQGEKEGEAAGRQPSGSGGPEGWRPAASTSLPSGEPQPEGWRPAASTSFSPSPWPFQHLSTEVRFLLCWFLVVFVFFSLAATKLPNYILPLYPAVALLMARALDDWRLGLGRVPDWAFRVSLILLGLIGVATAVGLALVGGVGFLAAGSASLLHGRLMPGLAWSVWLGLVPLAGAVLGWVLLQEDVRHASGCREGRLRPMPTTSARRALALAVVAGTSAVFLGVAASWVAPSIGQYRAPRTLMRLLPADQTTRDVRIATYHYFQPSLVFYCHRRVDQLLRPEDVREFLRGPLPSYLFLPAGVWAQLQDQLPGLAQPLGQQRDFYGKDEIVVVANQAAAVSGQ